MAARSMFPNTDAVTPHAQSGTAEQTTDACARTLQRDRLCVSRLTDNLACSGDCRHLRRRLGCLGGRVQSTHKGGQHRACGHRPCLCRAAHHPVALLFGVVQSRTHTRPRGGNWAVCRPVDLDFWPPRWCDTVSKQLRRANGYTCSREVAHLTSASAFAQCLRVPVRVPLRLRNGYTCSREVAHLTSASACA